MSGRGLRIGGSEIAAILGEDERKDAFSLWMDKKSGIAQQLPSIRMRLGLAVQKFIIEIYSEETGNAADWYDERINHPTRAYMASTPDALCREIRRGVDAKNISFDQRNKWGGGPNEIPRSVQLQAWWYMSALDYSSWDIAAFVNTRDLNVYTIERPGARAEAFMLERAEEFYQRFLIGDERPDPGFSEASTRYMKQLYPRNTAPPRTATTDEIHLLRRYAVTRQAYSVLEKEKDLLENLLRDAVRECDAIEIARADALDGWLARFSWKVPTKETPKTDWRELADSLMTCLTPGEKQKLIAQYTRTEPGSRRIHFRGDPVEGLLVATPHVQSIDDGV
jgi:predicted phage-related endonuclease